MNEWRCALQVVPQVPFEVPPANILVYYFKTEKEALQKRVELFKSQPIGYTDFERRLNFRVQIVVEEVI